MKLTHRIDIERERVTAQERVDAFYAPLLARPLGGVHDAKFRLAQMRDPLLHQEAQARGMDLEGFCRMVLAKSREEAQALLDRDAERLALKAQIAASTNAHEIRAMVDGLYSLGAGQEPTR